MAWHACGSPEVRTRSGMFTECWARLLNAPATPLPPLPPAAARLPTAAVPLAEGAYCRMLSDSLRMCQCLRCTTILFGRTGQAHSSMLPCHCVKAGPAAARGGDLTANAVPVCTCHSALFEPHCCLLPEAWLAHGCSPLPGCCPHPSRVAASAASLIGRQSIGSNAGNLKQAARRPVRRGAAAR